MVRFEVSRRTFLALPVSGVFLGELETFLGKAASGIRGVKWVNASSVHITLHFFGKTEEAEIETIGEVMREIAAQTPPLKLSLQEIGFFPDQRNPRVIWLDVGGEVKQLKGLQAVLEGRLQEAHFASEKRDFRAHATVGRTRRGASLGDEIKKLVFPATEERVLDQMILFESLLESGGPVYRPLLSFSLEGPQKIRS